MNYLLFIFVEFCIVLISLFFFVIVVIVKYLLLFFVEFCDIFLYCNEVLNKVISYNKLSLCNNYAMV